MGAAVAPKRAHETLMIGGSVCPFGARQCRLVRASVVWCAPVSFGARQRRLVRASVVSSFLIFDCLPKKRGEVV